MEYYLVSPLRVIGRVGHKLTYHFEGQLSPGQIVAVSVGKKTVPAVILEKTKKPAFETKPIDVIVTDASVPGPLMKLHAWLSGYYVSHPVAVWQTMLPSGLLKKRRTKASKRTQHLRERTHFFAQ